MWLFKFFSVLDGKNILHDFKEMQLKYTKFITYQGMKLPLLE